MGLPTKQEQDALKNCRDDAAKDTQTDPNSECDDEDDTARFSAVLSRFNLERPAAFYTAMWTPEEFDEMDADHVRSEALTMRLIRREKDVPLPEVLAFDATLDNELACPFILMSYIEGRPLHELWFDQEIPKKERNIRGSRALKDIANAMAKMSQLTFSAGGRPMFDKDENLSGVGPMRLKDNDAMLEPLESGNENMTVHFVAGPFTIGWDNVSFVPRLVGNERFPSFLTRDWDPAMYAWNEDMEEGIKGETVWEDSPDTLASHRKEYNQYMQEALRRGAEFSSPPPSHNVLSTTQLSLFVENLCIAAADRMCRPCILEKFVDKINELARNKQGVQGINKNKDDGSEDESLDKLGFLDITDTLLENEPDQEIMDLLKEGFDVLLSQAL
ncbi:hypothetical protein AJ79_08711 [Helicocarpus griseus UAMH5409]|uniref:Aminoglycoside phosphotransferase domain-containing protein n=1 Tax=Helicocarpus griseus UAMH5409 TaxID=1447875 RepID=A0A2B7WQW7_9EURO|nr:hypothetical protein AJ79_08711 [Helicocarpus griseus UAMH5409]